MDEVTFFPNPVPRGGYFNLNIPSMYIFQQGTLELYDVMGSKVAAERLPSGVNGVLEIPIDASISSGVYIFQLILDGEIVKREKFLVR